MKRAPDKLTTARLVGTPIGPGDLRYMVAMDSDPEVAKWLYGIQTREQSKVRLEKWMRHWDEHGFGFWVFRDANANEIGHAGLFHSPRSEGDIEVGYALKPNYWNLGYATEMTYPTLVAAFDVLELPKIIGIALTSNVPSRRVLEKSGLEFEHEYADQYGGVSARYSLTRRAWRDRTL